MKIAYLITAYNNPKHLNRLVRALDDINIDFYIHIDKKSKTTFNLPSLPNLFILKNRIKIYWGGYSIVDAELRLIKTAANKYHYDYFILLSGTDYPVKSNKYIKNFLQKNYDKEFINLCKMPYNNKSLDRINYYYISTYKKNLSFNNFIKRIINLSIRKLKIKRKFPKKYDHYILYAGSQWWAFSSKAISYILNFIDNNPEFVNFYKHTLIPDELFFHTIIGNSPLKTNVINSITYSNWARNNPAHPSHINFEHIQILSKKTVKSVYGNGQSNLLFARKFSDSCNEILNIIDNKFRK